MNDKDIKNNIAAMLFANGEPVSTSRFLQILEIDKSVFKQAINELTEELSQSGFGILIRKVEDSYQLCTNPLYFDNVRQLFEKRKSDTLSRAAYETLAIIAYNKQATRSKLESIRGNSDSPLRTLLERGLIIEAGRLDAPGRPVLYKPAEEFYRAFDVESLDDLIPLDNFDQEDQIEQIEQIEQIGQN